MLGRTVDKALSAFLDDLQDRLGHRDRHPGRSLCRFLVSAERQAKPMQAGPNARLARFDQKAFCHPSVKVRSVSIWGPFRSRSSGRPISAARR